MAPPRLAALRTTAYGFPFQAALKPPLAMQGVPVAEDCRAPLRGLKAEEHARLEREATTPGTIIAEALTNAGRAVAP